jgi:hypothetical protein
VDVLGRGRPDEGKSRGGSTIWPEPPFRYVEGEVTAEPAIREMSLLIADRKQNNALHIDPVGRGEGGRVM